MVVIYVVFPVCVRVCMFTVCSDCDLCVCNVCVCVCVCVCVWFGASAFTFA